MKKLIILAAALLITSYASAQQFGVKAGLNLANITHAEDGKFKPSIYLGATLECRLTDWLSFQPELVYLRQGTKGKADGEKVWLRTDYINLPLIFKFYISEKFSFDCGPQFGYMVMGKAKGKSGGVSVTVDLDKIYDTKDFDASLGVGLSYKLTENMSLSGRYNLGMTNVLDVGEKNKHSVIQLGLGYRF